jgi:hypothetical protein
MEKMSTYEFGMIGLGTMGRNLLLNMADHGVTGAGFDKDPAKGALLELEANGSLVKGFSDITSFIQSLKGPRSIMMLVPAGNIVDSVIEELLPLLEQGDILIDGYKQKGRLPGTKRISLLWYGYFRWRRRSTQWPKYDAWWRQGSLQCNETYIGIHCCKSGW